MSGWATGCGFTALLERLPQRPALLVLCYHRVGNPEECPYDRHVFSATVDQFDAQILLLKARYPISTLEEVQELAERPERMRHFQVLITFDDGYCDNYRKAFPILKSHRVQATFFLPTSFIGTPRIPWWDQVAFLVRNTKQRKIVLTYPQATCIDVTRIEREAIIRQLLASYKAPETTDTSRFLSEIEQACEISLPKAANEPLFMSWPDAAALVKAGMAIGSHTHSHELLAKESFDRQLEELRCSREILRSRLSVAADALAFPAGSRASFSSVTPQVLEQAGYRAAFSSYGGINRPGRLDRFHLLRVGVHRDLAFTTFRFRTAVAAVTTRQVF